MSGIAAIFNRDGRPVQQDSLWQMLGPVLQRGLDGCRVATDGPTGFGYAKLTLTPDERDERQPLVGPRTGCMIAADVRLDNRSELLALLGPGIAPGVSDATLILAGYERWGAGVFGRLLGDFAVVIWDPRSRRVLAARDPGALRPLYYHSRPDRILLASDIAQIVVDPSVPIAPNEQRIIESLLPASIYKNETDHAETWLAGIQAVPAGHYLVVNTDALSIQRHWELQVRPIRYRTQAEYAEHFRSLMSDAVATRLRSVSPVGVMLSGGLDSATIACLAQEQYRQGRLPDTGFVAFHIGFDGLVCDEREYIADIQAKYGFDVRHVSPGQFGGRLQLAPASLQTTPNLGVQASRQALFEQIVAANARVVLTGDVADACVIGSAFVFDSLLRQGRFREFARRFSAYHRASTDSRARILVLNCLAPLGPMALQKAIMQRYLQRNYERGRARLIPLYIEHGLRETLTDRQIAIALEAEQSRRFASPARETEYRTLYPPQAATPNGGMPIQFARPFADTRLHAFLLGIPPEEKYSPHPTVPGWYASSKQIIRRSMVGILPDSVRTRTDKTIFEGVVTNEFQQQWPDYVDAFGPASRSELAKRGLIDQAEFFKRLGEYRDGQFGGDFSYMTHLVGLETWLRSLALPRSTLTALAYETAGIV
ncbi:MAG TPA: asparagine synthase-related protein [Thermomicrobiales bacterium]|nr:asparagine synthase-related protein [Thermomicrobiales bacterium]